MVIGSGNVRRWLLSLIIFVPLIFLVLTSLFYTDYGRNVSYPPTPSFQSNGTTPGATHKIGEIGRLHFLLPANNKNVNLCKLIATTIALRYPVPTLIGWSEKFNDGGLLGGGSHVIKINGVLEYLESLGPDHENDLVFMVDAFDIWFQLPPEVLVSRYHRINAEANGRLRKRLGRAVEAEHLEQTIIFGAGKRCAPNQVHMVACYPIPASPLPDDVYGANTDTIMGRNKYTSLKQRYLNSGYIIGPVGDMRRLFRRAQEKLDEAEKLPEGLPEWDNGSRGSEYLYHGSDQSIFNAIWGEQEWMRESLRRTHRTPSDIAKGIAKDPPPTHIEGTIIDDHLNPSFTHEPFVPEAGKNYEFGIGVDYFSDLGQQTVNSEEDSRWIRYDKDIAKQVGGRHHFDCRSRINGTISEEIRGSRRPFQLLLDQDIASVDGSWEQSPLYSNLCLNTIPVMVHHNGDKGRRESDWPQLWLQPHMRAFLEVFMNNNEPDEGANGVVARGEGSNLTWNELCPNEMEKELFRDV